MNEELIKRIDERFVSLNDVPVRDVRLTREEWTQIRTTVLNCRTALSQSGPVRYVPMTDDEHSAIPIGYASRMSLHDLQTDQYTGIMIGTFSERYDRTIPVYVHPPKVSESEIQDLLTKIEKFESGERVHNLFEDMKEILKRWNG